MKIVKIFGLFHIWTKSKLMNRHSSQPFSAHYYTTSELITDNSYQFQSFADLNPSESAEDIKVQNKLHYGLPWSIVSKIIDKYPKWIYTVRACSRQAYRFCGVAIWPSYSPYNFNSQNYMNDPCIYYLWPRTHTTLRWQGVAMNAERLRVYFYTWCDRFIREINLSFVAPV